MTTDHARMAVLLRQVQWMLDDVAHDLPAGRAGLRQCGELATAMTELAALLRAQFGASSLVIDVER